MATSEARYNGIMAPPVPRFICISSPFAHKLKEQPNKLLNSNWVLGVPTYTAAILNNFYVSARAKSEWKEFQTEVPRGLGYRVTDKGRRFIGAIDRTPTTFENKFSH